MRCINDVINSKIYMRSDISCAIGKRISDEVFDYVWHKNVNIVHNARVCLDIALTELFKR